MSREDGARFQRRWRAFKNRFVDDPSRGQDPIADGAN